MQIKPNSNFGLHSALYPARLLKLNLTNMSQWFHRAYQQTAKFALLNQEPLIQTRVDRKGNQYWQVFDPTTKDTFCFDSENQVRVWLEQRYC